MTNCFLIDNLTSECIIEELNTIGVDPAGIKIMLPKFSFIYIKIKHLDPKQAIIIKQEMLSKGGEAAYSRNTLLNNNKSTDMLIGGTMKMFNDLSNSLSFQPFNLKTIAKEINNIIKHKNNHIKPLKLKNKAFDFNHNIYVMGILNLSPDSFYDGRKYTNINQTLKYTEKMLADGADIIDIGGESTRPGSKPISSDLEIKRTIPALIAIKKRFKTTISIDTYKPLVAKAAIDEGAEIINDITGLSSKKIIDLAVKNKTAVIIMHMQNKPQNMQKKPYYKDVISEVYSFLKERRDLSLKKGLLEEKIILDPGIGFGKLLIHNIKLIKHLRTFKSLNCPILIGPSRKSMIGQILNKEPKDRLMGTSAVVTLSLNNGANIIRVHDVGEMKDVVNIVSHFNKAP